MKNRISPAVPAAAPACPPAIGHAPDTLWLSYALARGLTARQRREALASAGSPQALGQALSRLLHPPGTVDWLDPLVSHWPRTLPAALRAAIRSSAYRAALAWQQAGANRWLLGLDHPDYPAALLATSDPPPLLYLQGRLASLSGPQVAIVGSRQATGPALAQARLLAMALADAGIGVVSGLALGIDAAAHRGALEAGGDTIAVQATAPDRLYPAAHRQLATQIIESGLLLTEFPPGSVLRPGCFPRRNRLISGLSLGVIVVEASLRSGSLITARHAADQGREVMAMPGSVANPQARGCHELLRQGATLVESIDDVLLALQTGLHQSLNPVADATGEPGLQNTAPGRQRSLPLSAAGRPRPATTAARSAIRTASPAPADQTTRTVDLPLDDPDAAQLLTTLGFDALSLDSLVERSGLSVSRTSGALARLEVAGQLQRVAGGCYRRCQQLPFGDR